jgi:hypothetical protein
MVPPCCEIAKGRNHQPEGGSATMARQKSIAVMVMCQLNDGMSSHDPRVNSAGFAEELSFTCVRAVWLAYTAPLF